MTDFVAVQCYRCKETFGLAQATYTQLHRSEATFHCPFGHAQHFAPGETEEQKLRRERNRLKQSVAQWQDEAQAWEQNAKLEQRRGAAARGQITKLKKRAAAGVCPCCHRHFGELQAHMATEHPSFEAQPLDQDKVA